MVEGGEIDSVNYVVASVGVEAGEEALSHETVPPEHIIAEAAAEVVKAQVAQAENDKRISLYTAVGQFNNQRQLCDVSRRAAAIAQERYALVMDRFRSGSASVTELNTARSESDDATQKYVRDIASFWNYYYTLRKLTLYDFLQGDDLAVDYDEMTQ